MSRPIRWGLLALALVAGWMHFGERLQPLIAEWAAPIEPAEFSDYRGDPEPITAPGAAALPPRASGPKREHIRDRVRRKVEADLERGARRNGP